MKNSYYSTSGKFGSYILVIFFLLFLVAGCDKPEPTPVDPVQNDKPVPAGARKVNIVVDKAYDLSKTKAHSILDSTTMSGTEKTLIVPIDFGTTAIFIGEASNQIMALVPIEAVGTDVLVNAQTVTKAMLTLIPSYYQLDKEKREEFERESGTIKPYNEFKGLIDNLLKNKQPIFSTSPEFINKVMELNTYILEKYLGDPKFEGGRKSSDDDFTKWLTRENGATLDNQVHSYVYAEFKSIKSGSIVSTIMEPQPMLPLLWSKTPLSTLNLKDDCYTVNINQTNQLVKDKNLVALSTGLTSLFMTAIFGQMGGGSSKNECIGQIAGVITEQIGTTVMGAANLTPEDLLIKVLRTGVNTISTAKGSTSCLVYLGTNHRAVAMVLFTKLNFWLQALNLSWSAYEFSTLLPYIISFVDPADLSEVMQLHQSKLKEACLKVTKDGQLNTEYGQGETIYPTIKLTPQSFYADWEKSDFEVSWIVKEGNGKVNLSSGKSKTDVNGKANIGWILPVDKSGDVVLTAEIKDKEGDHITGSPLEFKVRVTCKVKESDVVGTYDFGIFTCETPNYFFTLNFNADKTITGFPEGNIWGSHKWSIDCNGKLHADFGTGFSGQYNNGIVKGTRSDGACWELRKK